MTQQPASIRLRHCGKTFSNGIVALHPIDLHIEAGETVVLLGPSGCGKTTTLRIIAGLEYPDAGGEVFLGDAPVTVLPIEKRGVFMVFQGYALFPNMTVEENINYGLRVRGLDAAEQRRVDQLSGGQRQRVALGDRIIVMEKGRIAQTGSLQDIYRHPANAFVADFIGLMNSLPAALAASARQGAA